FEDDSYLRLLGWSHSGSEAYIASVEGTMRQPPGIAEVRLLRVSTTGRDRVHVARLKSTYPFTLQPSPDGNEIAFVSRQDGKDDIWVVASADGKQSRITANNNLGVY